MKLSSILSRGALLLAAGASLMGCYPYDITPELCKEAVPEGGCPTGRGGTCDDPSCDALYDCIAGVWEKTTTCDAQSTGGGGSGGQGGSTAGGGSGGQGGCEPISLDHTDETTGCTPDLQSPDCPAAAAEVCSEMACLTDCTDFYVCKLEAGAPTWTPVAYCDADGQLVIAP